VPRTRPISLGGHVAFAGASLAASAGLLLAGFNLKRVSVELMLHAKRNAEKELQPHSNLISARLLDRPGSYLFLLLSSLPLYSLPNSNRITSPVLSRSRLFLL
jgi:hypothetical protein